MKSGFRFVDLLFKVLSTLPYVTSYFRQCLISSAKNHQEHNVWLYRSWLHLACFCWGQCTQKNPGIILERQTWVCGWTGWFEGGIREIGPDLGWMWPGGRNNSVIGYPNNFYLGGRRLK